MSLHRISLLILFAGVLAAGPGCSQLTSFTQDDEFAEYAANGAPIQKIVCVWQAAEGVGLDGEPSRGFAGQIFFFTHEEKPVTVDGDISIAVRDDWTGVKEQDKPLHDFVFKGPAWRNHLRMSNIGPAYYVFVPYTRQGDYAANCSLRVKYAPLMNEETMAPGVPAYSAMTTVSLPGRELPQQATHEAARPGIRNGHGGVQQASHQTVASPKKTELQQLLTQLATEQQHRRLSASLPTSAQPATASVVQPDWDADPVGQDIPKRFSLAAKPATVGSGVPVLGSTPAPPAAGVQQSHDSSTAATFEVFDTAEESHGVIEFEPSSQSTGQGTPLNVPAGFDEWVSVE